MSAPKKHQHREYTSDWRPYSGPVRAKQNPMAQGWMCRVVTCKCGAKKRVNVNGRHAERGPWEEPQ